MGSHKKKLGLLSVWPEIMDSSPVIKTVIELKSVSVFSSIFQLQFVQLPGTEFLHHLENAAFPIIQHISMSYQSDPCFYVIPKSVHARIMK